MKKFKFGKYFLIILFMMIINYNKTYAALPINSETLFNPSTFDTLVLNIKNVPEVTVTGSTGYTKTEEYASDGISRRVKVQFNNSGGPGQQLDTTLTVYCRECGTLNGRSVDIKLIYDDIVTNESNIDFRWSAFKSNMTSNNEWGFRYVNHVHCKIYFYYTGENTPIHLDRAYLSIFSEDRYEGASSITAKNVYLYETTNIRFDSQYKATGGKRTYYNVYSGTTLEGNTEAGSLNCICLEYENTDNIDIDLYCLNLQGNGFTGYHFQYVPLTATVPSEPVKTVNKDKIFSGDEVKFNIKQKISKRTDESFVYSSLTFNDIIDENLTYKNIKVYDETGKDVTATAGTASYNSELRKVTYNFSKTYLKNTMKYIGKEYTFEVNASANSDISVNQVRNSSNVVINDSQILNSNDVTVDVYGRVISSYFDLKGNKISTDETIEKKVSEPYSCIQKDIEGYEFVSDSGNTTGNVKFGTTQVNYYYAKKYNLVIKYIDKNTGEEIADKITSVVKEGDQYKTEKKVIDGYTFVEDTKNTEGVVEESDIEVIYYYKKSCKVTVKHIDEETKKEIAPSEHLTGLENDVYKTLPKNIEGYDISVIPDNANGIMKPNEITVIYEYSKIKGKLTLIKKGENDINLSGVVFRIQKLDNFGNLDSSFSVEKTTDANGKIEINDLLIGSYRITEIKTIEGYELLKESIDFEITSEEREINLSVTNRYKLILPETGGVNYIAIISIIGILIVSFSMFLRYKKYN